MISAYEPFFGGAVFDALCGAPPVGRAAAWGRMFVDGLVTRSVPFMGLGESTPDLPVPVLRGLVIGDGFWTGRESWLVFDCGGRVRGAFGPSRWMSSSAFLFGTTFTLGKPGEAERSDFWPVICAKRSPI
jgi:hypothetical protein